MLCSSSRGRQRTSSRSVPGPKSAILVVVAVTCASPTQKQVNAFAKTYASEIVRIRVSEAPDYSGDPALFFRVLLVDGTVETPVDATKISSKIRSALAKEFSLNDLEIPVVIRFRSLSEQKEQQSPEWD
jgi:hypothetical protein